jgi:hypothetical protein
MDVNPGLRRNSLAPKRRSLRNSNSTFIVWPSTVRSL